MARPGEIQVRAGEGSDYGASAALQRQQAGVPAQAPVAAGPSAPPVQAAPGPPGSAPTVGEQPDLNGGYDPSLFGPTDRTHEPVTSGVPFGPGPSFVPKPQESDRDFLSRVAGSLEQSPGASNQVKAFAAAVKSGR